MSEIVGEEVGFEVLLRTHAIATTTAFAIRQCVQWWDAGRSCRREGQGGVGFEYLDTEANHDWYYAGGSKGNKDIVSETALVSAGKTF